MKFKFSLQKVLEHRKTLENIAQRDFQEALQVYNNQVDVLEDLKRQRHEAFLGRYRVQTKDSSYLSPRLQQTHEFLIGQDKRIELQKSKVQELENVVEKFREILREKVISTKIIEKLKEKKYREYLAERNILEQKELDEISVIRHGREDLE